MTETSARIVLVEDHAILREGLRALIDLESDLQVVGEASTGADGVRVVRDTNPTLVITDLALPGGSGLRTIDELRAACPNLRVLVLTAYCTDAYIGAAFSAGADGYVLKNASRAELLQAIRSVITGQKSFCEPVSARPLSGYVPLNNPAADALFAVRNGLLPRRDVDKSFIDEYRAAQSACRQRRQRGRLH